MAKESMGQRRARKGRPAKAEYYPKVDLTGSRRGPKEVLSVVGGLDLAAAAPAKAGPEAASPPPRRLDSPAAAALAATPAGAEPEGAFRLPQCLDLPAARPLAQALLERRGKPIVVDGSSVHQLGAQCVQVLLSAKRTWSADGVALSIVNCAPRMIEDLRLLGIDLTTLTSGEQPQCA
ncbi:MAG: STAS domain-containing protein [Roseiarcus sp.]|jgi:chemotaxis protein CheX